MVYYANINEEVLIINKYKTKYVVEKTLVTDSVVRRVAVEFEKCGYAFERKNGYRLYSDEEIEMMDHATMLLEYCTVKEAVQSAYKHMVWKFEFDKKEEEGFETHADIHDEREEIISQESKKHNIFKFIFNRFFKLKRN